MGSSNELGAPVMSYFIVHYGIWLSLAFVIGLLTALVSLRKDSNEALLRRSDFVPALCVLLFVAFAQVTLGRIALYAESAVFIAIAFLAGVGLVVAFIGRISRDHIGWKVGASSVAAVWFAANVVSAQELENDLKHRLGSLVERAGGALFDFEVSGRDVLLPVDTKDHAAHAERLRHAAGVRIVWTVDALSPQAARLRDEAIASATALAERRTAEAARAPPASANIQPNGANQRQARAGARPQGVKDGVAEGRSATRSAAEAVEAPVAPAPLVWNAPIDPTLPARGAAETGEAQAALDAHSPAKTVSPPCRSALSAIAAAERIHFAVASASLRGGSEPFLDRLAALLKQCPDAALEIGGHTDSQGDKEKNRSLSLRRAQSVADYLDKIGVERSRISSVGHGADEPLVAGDTPTSRAENRRVEFSVK